MSMYVACGDYL